MGASFLKAVFFATEFPNGSVRKREVPTICCCSDDILYSKYSAYLSESKRADERTRTADLISIPVINEVLQGFARVCKSRISKGVSFLCLALCCTVLRSRWCQSGVRRRWITRRRFLCKRDMQLRMRASTQPHRRL